MHFLRVSIFFTTVLLCSLRCVASPASIAHALDVVDPISGTHWVRVTDPAHPAAPPRLLPGGGTPLSAGTPDKAKSALCVRAGERVLLRREREGSALTSLEAVALQAGARGDRVRVRIRVTGALVEIKISGPGAGVFSREAVHWH